MSRTALSVPELLEARIVPATIATVREAVGLDATAILDAVELFRADLGANRQQINWDTVPASLASPQLFPGEFFNTTDARGMVLRTTGTGFALAGGAPTFTGERTLTPVGSTQTVVDFMLPGSRTPATVNGFGAVFSDVDQAASTRLTFLDSRGRTLTEKTIAPSPNGLSFVGVTFDAAVVARVRIVSGSDTAPTSVEDGPDTDAVWLDDLFFGKPTSVTLDVPDAQRISGADRLTFSSTNRNAIAVLRADNPIEVSLRVDHGTLRLARTDGLTFSAGDGTDDAALTFQGTITAVNQAMNGMSYSPVRGFIGSETLTVSAGGGAATSRVSIVVEGQRVDQNRTLLFATAAATGNGATVTVHNADGSVRMSIPIPERDVAGGVRVALGELSGDGRPEIVTAAGLGAAPTIRVYDGGSGKEMFSFLAYEEGFTGGVFVTLADLTGDGIAEIITTPDEGGGPRVRVFNGDGFAVVADFLGIDDPNFRGGARTATGDVNRDGVADLLVGAGFGGGPRLAIYHGRSLGPGFIPEKLIPDFFVFEDSLRNGVFLAAGDVNADGFDDVIAGGGPGGGPRVMVLDAGHLLDSGGDERMPLANFFAGDLDNRGGVRLAVKDLDGDARADLLVASGTDAMPQVLAFKGQTLVPDSTPTPFLRIEDFPSDYRGGIFVG